MCYSTRATLFTQLQRSTYHCVSPSAFDWRLEISIRPHANFSTVSRTYSLVCLFLISYVDQCSTKSSRVSFTQCGHTPGSYLASPLRKRTSTSVNSLRYCLVFQEASSWYLALASLHMWYSNCLLKSASNYYLRLESVPLPFSLVYLLRYPLSASWNSSFITYANTASSIDRLADVLFAIVIFSHKPPDFNCRLGVFDLYLTGSA